MKALARLACSAFGPLDGFKVAPTAGPVLARQAARSATTGAGRWRACSTQLRSRFPKSGVPDPADRIEAPLAHRGCDTDLVRVEIAAAGVEAAIRRSPAAAIPFRTVARNRGFNFF